MFTKKFYWYNFPGFCSNLEQSYWYKQRGLLFKHRRPRAFYWVYIDWLAPGHPMGAGNLTISRETETQVQASFSLNLPL